MANKVCSRCKEVKDLTEFQKHKGKCKKCLREVHAEWVNSNREQNNENQRRYYLNRRQKIKEGKIEAEHPQDKLCSSCKQIKPINTFKLTKTTGLYNSECQDCVRVRSKKYYEDNYEKIIKKVVTYEKNRLLSDPAFRITHRLRTRLRQAIKAQGADKIKVSRYIGCSNQFLQDWFEFQFYDGMTFENHGGCWHIEHVKPIADFDMNNSEDIKECFNWKNLRPYRAEKNQSKGSKIKQVDIMLQELKATVFEKKRENLNHIHRSEKAPA
jgi:hypothetical protein